MTKSVLSETCILTPHVMRNAAVTADQTGPEPGPVSRSGCARESNGSDEQTEVRFVHGGQSLRMPLVEIVTGALNRYCRHASECKIMGTIVDSCGQEPPLELGWS